MKNPDPADTGPLGDKRRALLRKLMAERGLAPAPAAGQATALRIPRRPEGLAQLPQSFAQRRLWFLDRLAPGNPFYTVSLAVPLAGALDIAALQQALEEVVRRHEALRTTFTEADGQALQRIAPPGPVRLDLIDLVALPAAQRAAEAERLTQAEAGRSFDLERGPLMVAQLLRIGPTEHQLLLTLHHIVCDGWSLRVLAHELVQAWQAFAQRRSPALPELPVQYADFALWQHGLLAGAEMDRQLAYWRQALDGAPELRLPADRARPAMPSFAGGLVPLRLTPADAQAVAALAAQTEATPFVVLMAAFMALLARLSGQSDIVVGTPIANRTRAELEPLIGFFVNTLVLRANLAGAPSLRTLVGQVRRAALDAYAHQDLPFERLVEALSPERVLGRNPLFQVIFQLFSAHDGTAGSAVPAARQRGTAKFDLRLDLWPTDDGAYAGELETSDDVFHRASAERMAGQFVALLRALLQSPDQPIDEASAMDVAQRRQVLERFNATDAPYPADCGVHQLFAEMVAAHPQRTALRCADATLRYDELDAAAVAMAARLARRGVRAGDAVGVLLERSAAMVIAWLGIWKLGAAYVPLDTEQPAPRLAAMLDDAGCRVVVSAGAHLPLLRGGPWAIERVDQRVDEPTQESAPPVPAVAVAGDALAQIIFTSGSTGRPKGVMVPHRGIARLVRGITWNAFAPGDCVAMASNPAFDASTYEAWSALANGSTLVEIARDTVLDAAVLARKLGAEHIDHLFLTTALFNRLVAEQPGMFARLKSLTTGGAKAEVGSFQAVLAAGAPQRLLHAYGPTEATVLTSVSAIDRLPHDALTVPIGRPITNTRCLVLDAQLRPVPLGAPGQLHVGGPGVALGYCGLPALSALCFIDDPFAPGGRLYATGDKVRWRDDGQLEFLGRFDDQLKIRGFRVEPDEIAAVLSTHPAVRSAVVLAHQRAGEGGETDHGLVAYVELHADMGERFDAAALAGAADALVAHWRALYDTVLYDAPAADPTFNTSGWNDTATGAPIPEADMAEQVGQTVARAQHLLQGTPGRVLEVGCGTGLLLFKLAPGCSRYVGTDLSDAAIAHVRRTAEGRPALAHLELVHGHANALDAVPGGPFDLVLLNSVVQYFPSYDYLLEVARACAQRLAPGGALLLGDLRHLGLLPAFQADTLLRRAGDAVALDALRREWLRRLDEEQELALAPAALVRLAAEAGFGPPRIELKRGRSHNELNRFRFDAVLPMQAAAQAAHAVPLHWLHDLGADLQALRAALGENAQQPLRIVGIPNARIARAARAAYALDALDAASSAPPPGDVAGLRQALDAPALPAPLDPEQLWAWGDALGRPVRIGWNQLDDACFDALVLPAGADQMAVAEVDDPRAALPPAALSTQPLHGHFARRLMPSLKAHLAERLPAYMVPDQYVRLAQLPLSPNGKIDRAALPAPERLRPELRDTHVAARTDTERRLAALWAQLLGIAPPGIDAHFFNDLGGHSLLATQVMSRVRSAFGVELPLRLIFEGPSIAALAEAVDAAQRSTDQPAPIRSAAEPALDVDALDEAALDAELARLAAEQP